MEYKQSQGAFSDDALAITEYQKIAERRKESPNPMDIWSHIETPGCLSELALHLFQAVPNSAAVERLFSIWGHLETSKANRRKPQKTADIACVRADINSHHQQEAKNRKRKIGEGNGTGDLALSTRRSTMIDPNDLAVEDEDMDPIDWESSN